MNKQISDFTKQKLKDGLSQLPEDCQTMFKRMYSPENPDADINDVVDNIQRISLIGPCSK